MPIYEFYCSACNTLFSFFSARVDTRSRPACPRCRRPDLERRPARFATLGRTDVEAEDPLADLGDERMAGLMESLADEMGEIEASEDPRALARLMRRFGEASGLEPGARMEEVLRRLESGEDPEMVEAELGDALDAEDSTDEIFRLKRAVARRGRRPRVDDTLHFL